jgi:hypothetical protein
MTDMLSGPRPEPDEWEAVDAEIADELSRLPESQQSMALSQTRLKRRIAEALWEQWKLTCRSQPCINARATPHDAMACAHDVMDMLRCNLLYASDMRGWGKAFWEDIRHASAIAASDVEIGERKRKPAKRRATKKRGK